MSKNNKEFTNEWIESDILEVNKILSLPENKGALIKIMDGNQIQEFERDAVPYMVKNFFTQKAKTWDQISDWMRDEMIYFEDVYDNIIFIIFNYSKSFINNPNEKKEFETFFIEKESGVLNHWDEEAPKYTVDGEVRRFNVYVID